MSALQPIHHYKILRFAFFAVLCVGISFCVSSQGHAQFADSACDPDYYESLESRAWLEAQREITQNQNLIFKPDSVLEYTCFDLQLGVLAEQAEVMFSETDRWGDDVLGSSSPLAEHMDEALEGLVLAATSAHLTANFSHPLLGGRSSQTYDPATSLTGVSYACNVMQDIWLEAKCMDFIENTTNDGFYTFADYRDSDDKRFLPSVCSGSTLWEAEIDTANAEGTSPPWETDDVETYLDRLFPTNGCGTNPYSRVKTGLVVTKGKATTTEYEEHACIVPGCYWDPDNSECTADEPD